MPRVLVFHLSLELHSNFLALFFKGAGARGWGKGGAKESVTGVTAMFILLI